MIHVLAFWGWHPLGVCPVSLGSAAREQCLGYNFWSGIGSDLQEIALPATIIGALLWLRHFLHQHFECHEEICKRLTYHKVAGTPYRACWFHHPVLCQHPHRKVPLHHIHAEHAKSAGSQDSDQ